MGLYLIAASSWYADPTWWLALLMAAAGLGFVIFVHEAGHFLAAKACGVKCEKFYIGFDIPMPKIGKYQIPSSFFKYQWGETEYGIGVLPLGGYVKMLGQDDDPRRAAEENERIKVRKSGDQTAATAKVEKVELDPRSYPAKKVWQRMIIISAGVIVNLIFAVIFAAFAYRNGVPYLPCVVGATNSGMPAWKAGLKPGDKIIQLTKEGHPNEHLRFDWDLRQEVGMNRDTKDMDVLVRHTDKTEEWYKIRPQKISTKKGAPAILGLSPMGELTLDDLDRANPELPVPQSDLKAGDKVLAINGQSIPSYADFTPTLWKQPFNEPLTVTVERTTKSASEKEPAKTEQLKVKVEPNHHKTVGLVMKYGPIESIRRDSPAMKAGLKEGDLIEAVQGQPVGDIFTLPIRLQPWFGKEIELTVQRKKGKDETESVPIKITPEVPSVAIEASSPMRTFGIDALGVALQIQNTIQDVLPNSPTAEKGLKAGDKLVSFRWKVAPGKEKEYGKKFSSKEAVPFDDESLSFGEFDMAIQNLPEGVGFELTWSRDGKREAAEFEPVADTYSIPYYGFVWKSLSDKHFAESWGEALGLGVRQTKEDAGRVVGMLKKLFAGKVSPFDLGGAGTIVYVAGIEAKQGWARLLIFLTMLSANLAVLNFLPIPALDGGHMMFLAWEGIFRKPVNERVQMGLTMAGVCCLLGLMIFVLGLDINRFFF